MKPVVKIFIGKILSHFIFQIVRNIAISFQLYLEYTIRKVQENRERLKLNETLFIHAFATVSRTTHTKSFKI
jgi:hypothetical protein